MYWPEGLLCRPEGLLSPLKGLHIRWGYPIYTEGSSTSTKGFIFPLKGLLPLLRAWRTSYYWGCKHDIGDARFKIGVAVATSKEYKVTPLYQGLPAYCIYVICHNYERSAKRGASLLLYTGEKSVWAAGRPAGRPWSRSLNAYSSGTGWPIHEWSS